MSSVRLSVTLVDQDHIGWKSWKLIARTMSLTPSLFVAQRPSTYSRGNMGKILRRLEVWCGGKKWRAGAHKRTSLKRIKIDEKLLWKAYRNSPTLVPSVPSPTSYSLFFPKIGVRNSHPKLQLLLSQEWVKLRPSNFVRTFTGLIGIKGH